jgi:hypothetical protein
MFERWLVWKTGKEEKIHFLGGSVELIAFLVAA